MVNERANGSETGTRMENKENDRAGNLLTPYLFKGDFWCLRNLQITLKDHIYFAF